MDDECVSRSLCSSARPRRWMGLGCQLGPLSLEGIVRFVKSRDKADG